MVLLLRKVYTKLDGESTFTKEGIYKTWWRGHFYRGTHIQNLVEIVPLLRNEYNYFGGESTLLRKVFTKLGRESFFTEKGIHKTWWSGYLYTENLVERVPLLRKVYTILDVGVTVLKKIYTKLDGENTFIEKSTYNT